MSVSRRITKLRPLRTLLFLGLCMAAAPFAHATVLFGTGGTSSAGSLVFMNGGVTITATAFSTTGGTGGSANTLLATATLGQYSYGLGVCNSNEQISGSTCTTNPPEHSVSNESDNVNGTIVKNNDFILLTFSQPVSNIQATLSPFGTSVDMDASFFSGTCASPCTTTNLLSSLIGKLPTTASIGGISGVGGVTTGSYTSCATACTADQVVSVAGVGVNWVLIGANLANTDGYTDYFKLEGVNYSATTPEPATIGLLGAGLLGLGLFGAKKKRSANS